MGVCRNYNWFKNPHNLKNEGARAISMRHVLAFLKKAEKRRFCFAIFAMKNASTEKNKVHHDEEHEKTKTMVVFIFSIDNQKVVVYGENEDYHCLRFFVLFVMVYPC